MNHNEIPIYHQMTKKVVSVLYTSALKDVFNLMNSHNIRHLPVVDSENKVVGIISDRDVMVKVQEDNDGNFAIPDMKVGSVMTPNPQCCTRMTTLGAIASTMIRSKISCLPVVNKNQVLVGIITSSDLLELLRGVNHSGFDLSLSEFRNHLTFV